MCSNMWMLFGPPLLFVVALVAIGWLTFWVSDCMERRRNRKYYNLLNKIVEKRVKEFYDRNQD